MASKSRKIQFALEHESSHAGAALCSRNGNPVDVGLGDGRKRGDRLRHFRGRHVLTLPAERVAEAVDEIKIAVRVPAHQVARCEPRIALLEHVAKDLLFGFRPAGVAVETTARARYALADSADRLPDLVRRAANAKSPFVAHGMTRFDVELYQCGGKAMRQEGGNVPDRARLALDIEQRNVAFGRSVEFQDLRDAEPGLELVPYVRLQPVTAAKPDSVLGLARMRRGIHQISAKLADILEQRAVPARHVVPEVTGGKFLPDDRRAAVDQDRAGGDHPADAVIERQA